MAKLDKYEKITISLPHKMLAAIKARTENGDYSSTSEAIREALRSWQREEEEYQLKLAALRNHLAIGAQEAAKGEFVTQSVEDIIAEFEQE